MDKETYDKLIKRINHRIDRNKERINDLDKRRDKLSVHGHWELGYFEGIDSELDNLIGIVETIYNEPVHKKEWEVQVTVYDKTFLMWIPANTVEQIGYGDLLIDGTNVMKIQGCIEYVKLKEK